MATKTVSACALLLLALVVIQTAAIDSNWFNAEEFSTSSYGVHITHRPVSVAQHYDPSRVLMLSSKVGQAYRCSLPMVESTLDHGPGDAGETDTVSQAVVDLLKPLESAPCLLKTRDWWTYEFCYGKEIRQFHLHNGQIQGDVISLGTYESDLEWTVAEQEKAKKSRTSRYHSQQYVNGTVCDLTGNFRRTEVRFYCGEGDVDRITAIAESQTCVYTLHITTAKICSSTYLRPPNRPRPMTISCDPVVAEADYQEFLVKEAEEKEKEHLAAATSKTTPEDSLASETDSSEDRLVAFQNMLRATVEKQFGFDLGDFEMHIMDDDNPVEQVMEEMMKRPRHKPSPSDDAGGAGVTPSDVLPVPDGSAAEAHTNQDKASGGSHSALVEDGVPGKQTLNAASEDVHPVENDVMQELREEITNLGVDADTIEKYKDNIQHAIGSKFSDILDEALQELRNEGVEADIDKDVAFRHMAASLASLLDGMGQKDAQRSATAATKPGAHVSEGTAAVESSAMPVQENPIETETPKEQLRTNEKASEIEESTTHEATAPAATRISIKRVRIEPKVEVKMVDVSDEVADGSHVPSEVGSRSADAIAESRPVRTVVAILQPAGRDARKEEVRHREMEQNYNRLWSKKPKSEL